MKAVSPSALFSPFPAISLSSPIDMIWLLLRNQNKWRQLLFPTSPFLPFFTKSPDSNSSPETLTLSHPNPNPNPNPNLNPFHLRSSNSYSTRPRNPRKSKKKSSNPPPINQSHLDDAISRLPPRFTPDDLTAALAAQPDPRLCLHLLTWAAAQPRFRPDPSAFLVAVKKLGAARLYSEMDSAASLSLSLPLPPSEPLLNTIIYFYTEARMLTKAVGVYKRARAATDPAARPTARTYNLLFAALLGRGPNSFINHVYMDTVRVLFRQMVEAGISPDVFTLNGMIRGYVGSLHLNDALRIFHQMGPVYGCEPDEHTYSWLVHGLCAQGRTRNARQLWDEARDKGLVPTGRACNSLVCALAMVGEVGEAVATLWEMQGMQRAADGITCRTVVEEMCRQGRVRDALGLLRELQDKEVVDDRTYRGLLHGIQDDYGTGDL